MTSVEDTTAPGLATQRTQYHDLDSEEDVELSDPEEVEDMDVNSEEEFHDADEASLRQGTSSVGSYPNSPSFTADHAARIAAQDEGSTYSASAKDETSRSSSAQLPSDAPKVPNGRSGSSNLGPATPAPADNTSSSSRQEPSSSCPINVQAILHKAVSEVEGQDTEAPQTSSKQEDASAPSQEAPAHQTDADKQASGGGAMPKLPARGGGGMPKLPERPKPAGGSKAGGAMPTLPPRRTAAPAPSAGVAQSSQQQGQASQRQGGAPTGSSNQVPGNGHVGAVGATGTGGAASGGAGAGAGGSGSGGNANSNNNSNSNARALVDPNAPLSDLDAAGPDDTVKVRSQKRRVQELRQGLVRAMLRLNMPVNSATASRVFMRVDMMERMVYGDANTQVSPTGPRGWQVAMQDAAALEARRPGEELKQIHCTVLVIGPVGVGKSALINRLVGEDVAPETHNADGPAHGIKVFSHMVQGIPFKFIDTPGLEISSASMGRNLRTLRGIHAAARKHKPDVVLYVDRMDVLRRMGAEMPMLRTITDVMGKDMWFMTVPVFTHGGSPPPQSASASISWEQYERARSNQLARCIMSAAQDGRMAPAICTVENHPDCKTNAHGHATLPDDRPWRPILLFTIASQKVALAVDDLMGRKAPEDATQALMRQLMGNRAAQMPLPWLLDKLHHVLKPEKPASQNFGEGGIKRPEKIDELSPAEAKEAVKTRQDYITGKIIAGEQAFATSRVATEHEPVPVTFDAAPRGYLYRSLEPRNDNLGFTFSIPQPAQDNRTLDHDDGVYSFNIGKNFVLRPKDQPLDGIPGHAFLQVQQEDRSTPSIVSSAVTSYYHSATAVSTIQLTAQSLLGTEQYLWWGQLEERLRVHKSAKISLGLVGARIADKLPNKGPACYGFKVAPQVSIGKRAKVVISEVMLQQKPHSTVERGWHHKGALHISPDPSDPQLKEATLEVSNVRVRGRGSTMVNLTGAMKVEPETHVSARIEGSQDKQGSIIIAINTQHIKFGWGILIPIVSNLWSMFRGGPGQ